MLQLSTRKSHFNPYTIPTKPCIEYSDFHFKITYVHISNLMFQFAYLNRIEEIRNFAEPFLFLNKHLSRFSSIFRQNRNSSNRIQLRAQEAQNRHSEGRDNCARIASCDFKINRRWRESSGKHGIARFDTAIVGRAAIIRIIARPRGD